MGGIPDRAAMSATPIGARRPLLARTAVLALVLAPGVASAQTPTIDLERFSVHPLSSVDHPLSDGFTSAVEAARSRLLDCVDRPMLLEATWRPGDDAIDLATTPSRGTTLDARRCVRDALARLERVRPAPTEGLVVRMHFVEVTNVEVEITADWRSEPDTHTSCGCTGCSTLVTARLDPGTDLPPIMLLGWGGDQEPDGSTGLVGRRFRLRLHRGFGSDWYVGRAESID
jgi:hypothetical protein